MMKEHEIENIDLLVVNLYQFEKTVAKEGVTLEEAIENIDIGGPAMLRSSAKNFRDVTVIVEELGGATSIQTRFRLAKKVFQLTHKYDGAISKYLEKVEL
jgi:phosphoribosylaminoimidazolecarboxamide formyltransferase/IMP cyclohydrolase